MGSKKEEVEQIQLELSNLEAQLLGYDGIQERFVEEMLEKFSPLINSLSKTHSNHFGKPVLFDEDDFYSEFFLYTLKYNLKEIVKRSTAESVWFPSIRRYFKNVLVNLSAKHVHYRNPTFGTDELDVIDLIGVNPDANSPSSFCSPEEDLLYKDCVSEVVRVLRKERGGFDLKVFNILLWPSKRFLKFSESHESSSGVDGRGKVVKVVNVNVIADYLKVTSSSVTNSFKRIRFVVESI